METLYDLSRKREVILKELKVVDDAISARKSETIVQCTSSAKGTGCGMASPIKDLVYIQTHWYTQPHGCTGGDYWNCGDGEFDCPHCGCRNRLYDRPDIMELKGLFNGKIDEYND